MLWVFALVVGLVFGLLTGGRIDNFARLKFRWPLLVLAALVVREAVLLTPLSRVSWAPYLYVLSLASIVAWTIFHFDRLPGIWLVTAGGAMNLIVIVANGGHMPVAVEIAGTLTRRGQVGQYTLMGPTTNLNLLGDWVSLGPLPEAYSPGDLLIGVGIALVVFLATRPRKLETSGRIVS
jgi:hypothetical protein